MMEAHNNGMGVVGRYAFEVAELYYASLQENGLLVDMVPVEEE
jgi:ATP-dependent Clp protease adapter protein ClpS